MHLKHIISSQEQGQKTMFIHISHEEIRQLTTDHNGVCSMDESRVGLKPMQLHWALRHGVWVDCSFLPDTPCA